MLALHTWQTRRPYTAIISRVHYTISFFLHRRLLKSTPSFSTHGPTASVSCSSPYVTMWKPVQRKSRVALSCNSLMPTSSTQQSSHYHHQPTAATTSTQQRTIVAQSKQAGMSLFYTHDTQRIEHPHGTKSYTL